MGSKTKVLTVVGTRPEIIKLSRVLVELERFFEHVLVHTGQNFAPALSAQFFEELGLSEPNYMLDVASQRPADTIARVIRQVDEVLEKETPDAFLVYGDTNSCLAALAAKRRQIPVFHMEAGNRCFDQRVPEEINRRIIDHLSDINMTNSEHARRYLLAEGIAPDTVIVTGSPMGEVIDHYRELVERSTVLERLGLEVRGYLLLSFHREENVDDPDSLATILDTLAGLAETFSRRILVSTHPRTQSRLDRLSIIREFDLEAVEFAPPFAFGDWLRLQSEAFCVVSDSGTLTEEAALLGFPAVMLREAHERPEGMDSGVAILAGRHRERVIEAVTMATEQSRSTPSHLEVRHSVSRQVARVISSHIDTVNRKVWGRGR